MPTKSIDQFRNREKGRAALAASRCECGCRCGRSFIAAVFALAAALSGSSPLLAQVERPDTAGGAASDTVTPIRLAPVDVTVLRSTAELELAPFAVSAVVTPERFAARTGLGLDEVLRGVPGVQVDNRYNYALGERISIRGFGARAQFGVRGVRMVLDGIPATLADGQTTLTHVDPRALERVEVLRGPASAMYGNAAGGVIRMRTAQPAAEPVRTTATAVGGGGGMLRLSADVGGRSGETSYGAGATRFAYDGFREHSRAEKLFADARFDRPVGAGELSVRAHVVDYDALNPGSLSEEQLAESRTQAHGGNVAQATGETASQGQLGLRWRQRAGPGALDVAVYGLARTLNNPIPPSIIEVDRRAGGLRAAYRGDAGAGAAETGEIGWTVGFDADLQRDDRRNFANEGGEAGELELDQLERVRAVGLFGQTTAEPLPRLALLAGVRYDAFRFEADDRLIAGGDPDDSGARSMDAVSPSIGLRYTASPALNLYGNIATSFETPTTTELVNRPDGGGGFNPELEPQRTRSFEVGVKGRVGERVRYEIAAYRARTHDALIPFEVAGSAGRQYFRNAGSTVHRGVELGAAVLLPGGLHARASYDYLDARFDDYTTDDGDLGGNRVPGAAPHRAQLALGYRVAGVGLAELEARHVGRMAVNDGNTAYSPAYTVIDVRTDLEAVGVGGVEARPFVGITNVFDAEYDTAVTVNAFGGRYHEPGPGRTLYGGLRVALGGG